MQSTINRIRSIICLPKIWVQNCIMVEVSCRKHHFLECHMVEFDWPLFWLVSFITYFLSASKSISRCEICCGCWWKPLDHAKQKVVFADFCCLTNSAEIILATCSWFSFTSIDNCWVITCCQIMGASLCLTYFFAWKLVFYSVNSTIWIWDINIDTWTFMGWELWNEISFTVFLIE